MLATTYGLEIAKNIRYIDTTRFVHCHNKMSFVDGAQVPIGSQNWSDSALVKNREAAKGFVQVVPADYRDV